MTMNLLRTVSIVFFVISATGCKPEGNSSSQDVKQTVAKFSSAERKALNIRRSELAKCIRSKSETYLSLSDDLATDHLKEECALGLQNYKQLRCLKENNCEAAITKTFKGMTEQALSEGRKSKEARDQNQKIEAALKFVEANFAIGEDQIKEYLTADDEQECEVSDPREYMDEPDHYR
jgi:hypothetical protein